MELMCGFQMRLAERKRPSCVKEAEMSSSSPFMRTFGKIWLRLPENDDMCRFALVA